MKKIFTLAAAVITALTVSAQGFDYRTGGLGDAIYGGSMITDQNNITLNETDAAAHKYEIKITTGGECSFKMGGVEFWYSNSNDGTVAYKTYGTYIQPNGNKRKMTIPVIAGKTIKIGVQDAVTVAAEGATATTINLVAWGENKDQLTTITPAAGATEVVIWSDDRSEAYTAAKWKLGAVIYEGGSADPDPTPDPTPGSGCGFSAIDNHLGLQIMNNNLIQNINGVTVDQAAAFDATNPKYEIKVSEGGVEGSFTMGGVVFKYTNSTAGTIAFKTYGTYIQPNGKDRIIEIPAAAATVNLVEACAGVLVNEVSTDLVAGDNALAGVNGVVTLKIVSNKPKISAISYSCSASALEETVAPAKAAVKVFENGKLFIIKNGVKYNAAGVVVK